MAGNPYLEARDLLATDNPVSGQVVAINHGVARVATPHGVIEVNVGKYRLRPGQYDFTG